MKTLLRISTLLMTLSILTGGHNLFAQSQEYTMDSMTFGMPEAEVFTEDYDAPPVVGDYITMLPNLAPLDYEGNKHHEIRLDTFVQEVEVADGVRYCA